MDLEQRRSLYNGFGDAAARAFEYAGAPLIFGYFGYVLDRRLDLMPVFTILMVVLAVVGTLVRMYYGYAEAMRQHEVGAPWARPVREPE